MKFTGRAIQLDKSFVYIVYFKFKSNGKFIFIPTTDIDEVLQVRDEFDVRQTLQIIDPSIGKETLSIHIALDRYTKDQYLALEKKVKKWVEAIIVYSLPLEELFASVSSTILKIIEYPIASTTFIEQECNRLVKLIFDLVLAHYNICCLIPLAIKYGPRLAMGLGFKNLFLSQGVAKLSMFLEEQ